MLASSASLSLATAIAAAPATSPVTASDRFPFLRAGVARTSTATVLRDYVLTISGGTATIAENLALSQNLTVTGVTALNGNMTFGNTTSDTITATGRFASVLTPSTANTRDLGDTSLPWRTGYFGTSLGVGFTGALASGVNLDIVSQFGVRPSGSGYPTAQMQNDLGGRFYAIHTVNDWGFVIGRAQNDNGWANVALYHTRNSNASTRTALTNGDGLGRITFQGPSSTTVTNASAAIATRVSGTVSSGTLPTQMEFYTAETSDVMTGAGNDGNRRWIIEAAGHWVPGATNTYTAGSSSSRMSNIFSVLGNFSGAVTASTTVAVGTNLTVGGNTTLGDATSDTITATAQLASTLDFNANNSYAIGSATRVATTFFGRAVTSDAALTLTATASTLALVATSTNVITGTVNAVEGFRVTGNANATTTETSLWNQNGPVMGGLASSVSTALFIANDGGRFANRVRIVRVGAAPVFVGEMPGGTLAAPTQSLSGNSMVSFIGNARTDTATQVSIGSASIFLRENATATAFGSGYLIQAVDVGAATLKNVFTARGGGTNIAEWISDQSTTRIIPGATALVIRDSANAFDAFAFTAAGALVQTNASSLSRVFRYSTTPTVTTILATTEYQAWDGSAYGTAAAIIGEALGTAWGVADHRGGLAFQATISGATTPVTMARLSDYRFYAVESDATANGPSVAVAKSRGSAGSELYPNSGDALGDFAFRGYAESITGFSTQARIQSLANGTWTASNRGADMYFATTANGSTTLTTALTLTTTSATFNGLIGVGTAAQTFAAVITGQTLSGSGTQRVFQASSIFGTGATGAAQAFRAVPTFASGSYTTPDYMAFYAPNVAAGGGGHVITNWHGLYVETPSGGTNNYAIRTLGGQVVFNDSANAEADVRMEGDTLTSLFHLDTSTDRIGINTATPAYLFDVNGTANATAYRVGGTAGATGTSTAGTGTVTVVNGIVTAIT